MRSAGLHKSDHLGERNTLPIKGVITGRWAVLQKRIENTFLIGVPALGSILAIIQIFQGKVTLIDIASFLLFYLIVGLGVALGLHRYFSHKSFNAHPALAFFLGAAGTMSFQGSIYRWVADHRRHHAHTDESGDVHSPVTDPWGVHRDGLRGFWHAHVGWMFDGTVTDKSVYGHGLMNDPVISFFTKTHSLWLLMSLVLPGAFGYVLGGKEAIIGAVLFGGCLRTTVLHQVVWSVNSFGHSFGTRNFDDHNHSTNNKVLAILTFGDGWHNNHHRYPRSYRHGLAKGELDINGIIVDYLQKIGLVRDVIRIPSDRLVRDFAQQGKSIS